MAAAAAFGAPFNVVFWGVDEGATLTSAVERRGILSVGTELGGWGRVNVEGVRIADRGLQNILRHFGLIDGEPDTRQRDGAAATRHMMVRDQAGYCLRAGRRPVRAAQRRRATPAAPASWPGSCISSRTSTARRSRSATGATGILWMSAGPGRVQRGDVVAVLMEDYDDELAAG